MLAFEKLEVYQCARSFVKQVYTCSANFPSREDYALTSQIRRAAVSITSNIAEGTSRFSNKDKAHFIEISYGSLMEVVSQLQVALDMNYITQEQYDEFKKPVEQLSYKLFALRRSYELKKTKQ